MSIGGVPTDRRVAIVAGVRDATALLQVLAGTSAVVVGVVAHEDPSSGRAGLALLTSRARAFGVPVLAPRAVTIPMAVDWLRNLALDYLVCVGWTSLLTEEMLRVPRHGTIGMRRTPLLRTHHLASPDWALLRGETVTGHPMLALVPASATAGELTPLLDDAAHDGGDDPGRGLFERLADLASRLLEAELEDVAVRRSGGRALERPPRPELAPLGLTSFDRSVEDVHRWVSALGHPRRGAFGTLRRETVVIWSCEPAGSRAMGVPPGTVLGADDGGVVVTTRTGSVRLLEVQAEGGDPEPATTWFARRDLPPGCAFEPVSWTSLEWMLR